MRASNWLVADYLEHCRRAGLDGGALLAGLPFTSEELRNKLGTVPWDAWAELLERVQDGLDGAAAMEEFASGFFPSLRALQLAAGLFVDVEDLYLVFAPRMGRAGYRGLDVQFVRQADGRIRVEGLVRESARGSLPFWNGTIGSMRSYPRLLGLPDAQVEAELTPRRAVFWITPPASRTLMAQARRATAPFSAVLRRRFFGSESAEDLLTDLAAAEEGASLLDEVSEAGQRLVAIREIGALADAAAEWMVGRAACTYVDLSFRADPPVQRRVGDPGDRTLLSRRLVVSERVVGRVDWAVEGRDGAAASMLEAMLPWLAVAVEGCGAGARGGVGGLSVKLARARERWGLTPRQVRVVELVARGSANKEIAAALGCSTKGVEAHLTVLYRKAGTDSRTGLVARVWESLERP